ncbi:MAG: DUF4199 family protein [Bacteroidales bacterium]|nr:DUF4199 family protein [Bacteroidales bacterium]
MESLLLRTSIKFGLILGGINITFGLLNTIAFNPEDVNNSNDLLTLLLGFLTWCFTITCLAWAHYEFNKRNENYLSFADALFIGLIILVISFIISVLYSYLNYEFLMKEKLSLYYSNLSDEFGVELNDHTYSMKYQITTLSLSILFQILVLFALITLEAQWKIYKKAGKPGWASIIPFYNIIVLMEIIEKPVWWFILLLIPFVNIVMAIWVTNLLAKKFGKDESFTIGLIFLPFIFYPLLGLSRARYIA